MTLLVARHDRAPHRAVPTSTAGGRRGLCGSCGRGCHEVRSRVTWLAPWWRHDPRRARRVATPLEGALL